MLADNYIEPGTALNALHLLIYLTLTTTLWCTYCIVLI